MRKAIGWLLTPLHLLLFIAVLLVFHVAQVVARPFGYDAHKRVVDFLNLGVLATGDDAALADEEESATSDVERYYLWARYERLLAERLHAAFDNAFAGRGNLVDVAALGLVPGHEGNRAAIG